MADDRMIEDGALTGRKLLVIPNSSTTVTSRRAFEAIRHWVENGGTVVGFGQGCLSSLVEEDRTLTRTPPLGGLAAAEALPAGTDRAEAGFGSGRAVLYARPAASEPDCWDALPRLLAEAERTGVRFWCRTDGGYAINVMYAGLERNSRRHLFVADLAREVYIGLQETQYWHDRAFGLTFHPSLSGESELVSVTDSFKGCHGGSATYDEATGVLVIRFHLPGALSIAV